MLALGPRSLLLGPSWHPSNSEARSKAAQQRRRDHAQLRHLERASRAATDRAAKGALATVRGIKMRYLMRKSEVRACSPRMRPRSASRSPLQVLIGRSTDEQKVDVDLGLEGALRSRGCAALCAHAAASNRECVQGVAPARLHPAAQGRQVLPAQRRCVFIASTRSVPRSRACVRRSPRGAREQHAHRDGAARAAAARLPHRGGRPVLHVHAQQPPQQGAAAPCPAAEQPGDAAMEEEPAAAEPAAEPAAEAAEPAAAAADEPAAAEPAAA